MRGDAARTLSADQAVALCRDLVARPGVSGQEKRMRNANPF
jgi:hypothetical protein